MIYRRLITKIFSRTQRLILTPRFFTAPVPSSGEPNRTPPGAAADQPKRDNVYRELENLNFSTAAKILFSDSPRKKKFGLDFHLVQLFFTCLPSLAVYLVALYARSEIRRMEAEVEEKKKQAEEAEKAKEAEIASKEEESDPKLFEVKVRLTALEETMKELVDERKRPPVSDPSINSSVKKEQVAAGGGAGFGIQSKTSGGALDAASAIASDSTPPRNALPEDKKQEESSSCKSKT